MLPELWDMIGVDIPEENVERLSHRDKIQFLILTDQLEEARRSLRDLYPSEFVGEFFPQIYELLDLLKIEGYEFSKDGDE